MTPEDMAKITYLTASPEDHAHRGLQKARAPAAFARLRASRRAYAGDLEDVRCVMLLHKRKRVVD
jgi:hypothetical protein